MTNGPLPLLIEQGESAGAVRRSDVGSEGRLESRVTPRFLAVRVTELFTFTFTFWVFSRRFYPKRLTGTISAFVKRKRNNIPLLVQ